MKHGRSSVRQLQFHGLTLLSTLVVLMLLAPLLMGASPIPTPIPPEPDISTVLMQSTFEIKGPAGPNGVASLGTSFVVGKPLPGEATRANYVLVTAAHVLDSISGQQAIIVGRKHDGDQWTELPFAIRIRDENNAPLWVRNPNADVAAMYIALPSSMGNPPIVSSALFADDNVLQQFEVRPGDRVFVLGFPLGVESPTGGFPILRAGWIASYPLTPSRLLGRFLVSFEVFQGNSGGPVFLVDYNRFYHGSTTIGAVRFLMGLVSEEETKPIAQQGLYASIQQYPLHIAVVVPSALIADTVNMLGPPPPF